MNKILVNWGRVIGLSILIGVFLIVVLVVHYVHGEAIGVTILVTAIIFIVGMCAAYIHSYDFPGDSVYRRTGR